MGGTDEARARARARIGAVLNDKWKLEKLIGLGGMAAVYEGRHRNGARGAVKLLHPELALIPEVRDRFLREGYAANKVNHPNAVRVLDDDVITSGPDEGSAYLIMELLEGTSLEDRIHDGGRFTIEEALFIADDVLSVLAAAHEQGVIHRDLKPENLLLAAGDGPFGYACVKVLDFGLARLAHGEVVTRAGMALGTPSYMAPEQGEGKSELIDGRSDLFAVGAVLFRLITGRKVHEAANVVELVTKMARLPAPKIKSVRSDVPDPFAAIVDRALEFKPRDRYQTAEAMRSDVRAVREGRAISMQHEPTQAVEVEPRPALRPQPTDRARAKPRSVGVVVSVIWVLLVTAAGAAVLGVMRKGRVDTIVSDGGVVESTPSASDAASAPPSSAASVEDLASPETSAAPHASKTVATAKPKLPLPPPKKPPPKKKK